MSSPPLQIRLTDTAVREDGFGRGLVRLTAHSGANLLHLDLGGITPTAGVLGKLVALRAELEAAGVGLALRNAGAAYEVFEVTGLTGLLDVRAG
jgi:hypothetical protein